MKPKIEIEKESTDQGSKVIEIFRKVFDKIEFSQTVESTLLILNGWKVFFCL